MILLSNLNDARVLSRCAVARDGRFYRPYFLERGFTLIELLVVVGIIAVLGAILMPAFTRGRSQANKTKCLSNLRQIQLATINYANEDNGVFPSADREFGFPHEFKNFEESLGKYLQGSRDDILFCPGDLHKVRNASTPYYDTHYMSYQYFNFPQPFLDTFSKEKPDLTRMVTLPSDVPLWGCLSVLSADGKCLGHSNPNTQPPISGMNAVYADGHGKWVEGPMLEAYWRGGGSTFYWPTPTERD